MRLQLRTALVERCAATDGTLPCAEPLPEASDAKPRPLIELPPARRRRPCWLCPCCRWCTERPVATGTSLALLVHIGCFGMSLAMWAPDLFASRHPPQLGWALHYADILLIQLAGLLGVLVAHKCECARVATALGSVLFAFWLGAKALDLLIHCADPSADSGGASDLGLVDGTPPAPPSAALAEELLLAAVHRAAAASPDAVENAAYTAAAAAAAAAAAGAGAGVNGSAVADDAPKCNQLETIWPAILCGLIALAAALQICVAFSTRGGCSRRAEIRLTVLDGHTTMSAAAAGRTSANSTTCNRSRAASRVSVSDLGAVGS